jgi:hypothetical protein
MHYSTVFKKVGPNAITGNGLRRNPCFMGQEVGLSLSNVPHKVSSDCELCATDLFLALDITDCIFFLGTK